MRLLRASGQVLLLGLPVFFLAWMGWRYRNMFDDGYIYLHIVQNVLAGNGPVFNAGQRVEVYTGPLWLGLLSLGGLLLPLPLYWIAVLGGLTLSVGGVALASAGSFQLGRRSHPGALMLPLGALVFVAVPPVWTLATMGLEGGLAVFWLAASFWFLVRWAHHPQHRASRVGLIVFGLGTLVRPEFAIFSIVFLLVILLTGGRSRSWRARLALIGWAVAVPLAYEVFRMGYFGMLTANTAIAKEGTMTRPSLGLLYLWDFLHPYWLLVPLALLVVGAFLPALLRLEHDSQRRFEQWAYLALPLGGLINAAYVVAIGGDYIHARLLFPAFFAIIAPVAALPATRQTLVSLLVVPWALLAMTTLRSTDAFTVPFSFPSQPGVVRPSQTYWVYGSPFTTWYKGPGLYAQFPFLPSETVKIDEPIAHGLPPRVLIAGGIGLEAFYLGTSFHIFDYFGLADPIAAHIKLVHRGHTGHEKPLPTPWIIALTTAPSASTAPFSALEKFRYSVYGSPIPYATGHELSVQTAWARAAVRCPAIHGLEYSVSEPLTLHLFFSNMVNLYSRTTMRIPADPEAAYHLYCGPGTPRGVLAASRAPH